MKVKWLIEEREIPGVGKLNLDDIKVLPPEMAKNLIKQGFAEEVKDKDKGEE